MRRWALLTLLLSMGAVAPMSAQDIRGEITDEATGAPVENASVVILNSRGIPAAPRVLSDANGRFSMERPEPGIYRLEIQRIGYSKVTTLAFELEDDGEPVTLSVKLVPQLVEIDPITLEVRAREQLSIGINALEGFRYRAANGFGHYIDRPQLDSLYPSTSMMAVLRTLRGINIGSVDGETVATSNRRTFECGVKWWLDGRAVAELRFDEALITDSLQRSQAIEQAANGPSTGVGKYSFQVPFDIVDLYPEEVMGIEVYNGIAATPAEFAWLPYEPYCAAVVVWTDMWVRREQLKERANWIERRDTTSGGWDAAAGGGSGAPGRGSPGLSPPGTP